MKCVINGDTFTFDSELSVHDVIQQLELDEKRVIVEHNEDLLKRDQYEQAIVKEADKLELLEVVGGG
ncbi:MULTISPECIES: sulfur carrier protein ThiS [Staphylococcus]|uniref:Sulfur carrier protein ThiS n=1 Tax=Staphylococcus pettenkoferi TaxID=170573 RepID=A0A1Z3U289_9STAP|nr:MULTISPECIES: sulfur carrier protein ThiS [Staphylococcus]ASE37124.1 thiamine biosynthesis protein ThiS [Staphylococcus pettenkoferi]EHM68057.1 thiamine biosynthesis protein ThiS [Staphylococcus pettenkoferi VCU012]MBX8994116.1 sulfur carrier protein ThiS [Staphylococcus pettenkoferi]MCI2791445.1 sulfur carrier protein ThiS [Staphylococcus pettenkoferi]MCY1565091.1 sulfur carrier protein ThiS [Staphylococcus pettenkoferi]